METWVWQAKKKKARKRGKDKGAGVKSLKESRSSAG